LIFGFIALNTLQDVGEYSETTSTELGEHITNDTTAALREQGEAIIRQKANDVARQMEIYIDFKNESSIADLQKDPVFLQIAVQDVGETGYTVVLDVSNGTYYFHRFSRFVNNNSKELFDDPDSDLYNSEVWALINHTLVTQENSGGYYSWYEVVDNIYRDKYVYFSVLNQTTADGVRMFVAATTYIDEFDRPVVETTGKIQSATKESNEHIEGEIDKVESSFIITLLFMSSAIIMFALYLSRRITGPIQKLSKGVGEISEGNLEYRVEVNSGDELEDLAMSFNTMASDLKHQMNMVEEKTREKEKIEQELKIANEIQKSFLPIKAPNVKGYNIAGVNIPAREVGGDFYDFIDLGKNKTGVVIADVSGKGVPAALFMVISKTLVRVNAKRVMNPVEAILEANSILLEESDSGMFVTLFYGIIDLENNTMSYVNAGHNPPILLQKEDLAMTMLQAKGIPLGVQGEMNLELKEIDLKQNELVFLYTDGVIEAVNDANEEFGLETIKKMLTSHRDSTPQEIIESVLFEIKQFAGKRNQHDDITMMIIQSEAIK
jgi:serine phosphatase RsbU (regulator of sigma subunit)